jgi:uncharacterized membrane protein
LCPESSWRRGRWRWRQAAAVVTEGGASSGTGEAMHNFIEFAALGIEGLAVAIIVVAIVHGTIRYLWHLNRQVSEAYERYKVQLGKALLLGLEFLVAADIIRTVVLEQVVSQSSIFGQNPKTWCQEFNDLQTPKLSKQQLCDRTLMLPGSTTTHENRIYKATLDPTVPRGLV